MILTPKETLSLARRLAARHIADTESWLYWEDLPELTELSFRLLSEEMEAVAASMRLANGMADLQNGIDSAALEEEARG